MMPIFRQHDIINGIGIGSIVWYALFASVHYFQTGVLYDLYSINQYINVGIEKFFRDENINLIDIGNQ